MSSTGAAGNHGTSSNPSSTEVSPRRSRGEAAAPLGSPRRGDGSPPEVAVPVITPPQVPGSGPTESIGAGGALRIGGTPPGRKRKRDAGAASGSGGGSGGDEGGEVGRVYKCCVCNRGFSTPQAMFGHMRAHPDRGWTGAHPPPTFKAEEEFADLRAEAAEEEGAPKIYRVPDLNKPPPPEPEA